MTSGWIAGYLYRDSDNAIEYRGAKDLAGGNHINNATMRVWLYTRAGVEVPGASWPIAGNYIPDSDGDYIAIIQDGIDWEADTIYELVVEIDGGNDLFLTMHEYREIVYKGLYAVT